MDNEQGSYKKTVALILRVHRDSGPAMPEAFYEHSFTCELNDDRIDYKQQATMPRRRKTSAQIPDYRADLVINGKMVVELKSIR
jgi:GxxExxY protein